MTSLIMGQEYEPLRNILSKLNFFPNRFTLKKKKEKMFVNFFSSAIQLILFIEKFQDSMCGEKKTVGFKSLRNYKICNKEILR